MATVVSFINFKGGVGKTTLSVELAASLYKRFNSRVLMVDLDPQSNSTLYWLNEADWEKHINSKGTLLSFFEACLDTFGASQEGVTSGRRARTQRRAGPGP